MRKELKKILNNYQKEYKSKHKRRLFVLSLSLIISFSTAATLMLPALTMETICGLEEHQHGDECYITKEILEQTEIICGFESSDFVVIHKHNEFCYGQNGDLICQLPEVTEHHHTDSCFDENGDLICDKEEIVIHSHTAECNESGCTLDEIIAHQHTYECLFKTESTYEQELTCQLPEHVHTDGCYSDENSDNDNEDQEQRQEVDLPGYDDEGQTIIPAEIIPVKEEKEEDDLPEEINSGENENYVIDPFNSSESAEYVESALSEIVLTGDWACDVLAVAKSQIGYRESTTDYRINKQGRHQGYTYFGDWYGIPYGDWCAMFVSFCLDTAEVKNYPHSAGCQTWIEKLKDVDMWHPVADPSQETQYIPKPGDMIFYDYDLDGVSDHVGLVYELIDATESEPSLIKTIEGNYSDKVCYVTHAQEYEGIMGFGELPQNPDLDEDEEDEIILSCETETGFLVTLKGPRDSFPESVDNMEFQVKEILKEAADENEIKAFEGLDNFVGSSEFSNNENLHLFDITLTSDKQEIQPTGAVSVSFIGLEDIDVCAYHVSIETVESLEVSREEDGDISFETEHFSWFALILGEKEPLNKSMMSLKNLTSETASLTVRKTWSDGGNSHPESVTVTLYDENGSTGRTLTLSAANNWKGEFTGLTNPPEGQDLGYYVVESPVDNYFATYGNVVPVQTVTEEAYWVPVSDNRISAGGTYVFCTLYGGRYYTLGSDLGSNTNYMPALAVTRNGQITINGITYSNYLTGVDDSAMFMATQSGQGYILSNAYTGKYLTAFGYCAPTLVQNNANYILNMLNGGRLGAYNGSRYIRQTSANGAGNHDFSNSTNSSQASTFQVYERVYVTSTENSYETSITNTYINSNPGGGDINPDGPEIHKTIDYLGDGVTNPDTSLSGNEYYRLNLDITAAKTSPTPVDLLLVLDNSGSMFVNSPSSLIDGKIRNRVLWETLVDLLPDFLASNPQNRVSIVYFSGPSGEYVGWPAFLPADDPGGNPSSDAWLACDWTTDSNTAIASLLTYDKNATTTGSGTNYAQGLVQASTQLATVNSGHTPYVLFLSDGVPSYYVKSNGTRGGNGFDTVGMSIMSSWYNKAAQNLANCRQPTLNSINSFLAAHSDVTVSTIAFSPEMQGDRVSLLQAMPNAGGFYKYAGDTAGLYDAISSAFKAAATSGVSITDVLSPYVQLYADQADYKVTMRNVSIGHETVLYENGAVTQAGNGILDSVTYAPSNDPTSTGTVKLNFNPSYELDDDYVYTLSFNVKVTQEAYDTYNDAGQQYPHVGDQDTDYVRPSDGVSNETSSNRPGLHSNSIAFADYTMGGSSHMSFYPHPVVQVQAETADLTISKQVIGEDTSEAFKFEIIIKDSSDNVVTNIPAGQGYTIDTESGKIGFSLMNGQSVTISGLPKGATATITETDCEGYVVLIKEGNQTIFSDNSGSITLDRDREILFVNNAGTILPETGGMGAIPYSLSGIAIMLISVNLGYRRRKKLMGGGDKDIGLSLGEIYKK